LQPNSIHFSFPLTISPLPSSAFPDITGRLPPTIGSMIGFSLSHFPASFHGSFTVLSLPTDLRKALRCNPESPKVGPMEQSDLIQSDLEIQSKGFRTENRTK
jgi:hypothetical protein